MTQLLDPLAVVLPSGRVLTQESSPPRPRRFLLTPSPDHPDDYILALSNNSLEPFTICQRKAENRLVRAREGLRSDSPMDFGALFHSCEELRLRYGLTEDVKQKQRQLVSSHFLSHHVPPEDHRTGPRMREVLDKYNALYTNDGWPGKVLRDGNGEAVIERRFELPLCTIEVNTTLPYQYGQLVVDDNPLDRQHNLPVRNLHILWTGILDVLLTESSFLWVVDHKTDSGHFPKEFQEGFHLSIQTVGYAWAAQKITGHKPTGCLINQVICRPPHKTARGQTPTIEFNRLNYFYDQDRIDEWEEDVKATISDLVSSLIRGYFPKTGPKSFKSPCVYCEYHENCRLPLSQRAADLASGLYRDVTRREETPE